MHAPSDESLAAQLRRMAVLLDEAGTIIAELRERRNAARLEAERKEALEREAAETARREAEARALELEAAYEEAVLEDAQRTPPPAPAKRIVRNFSPATIAKFRVRGRFMGMTSHLPAALRTAAFVYAKEHGYEAAIAHYSHHPAPEPPPTKRVLRTTRPVVPPRLVKKRGRR